MTTFHQDQALKTVHERYNRRVMNNIHRADYIECLVASVLGPPWELPWRTGYDWAPWDLEHPCGAKLEIKHSAALQPWHLELGKSSSRTAPTFDIARRKGYWTREGAWIAGPVRPADIYLFAWHGETEHQRTDHRDPDQWAFHLMRVEDLPEQKTFALSRIQKLGSSVPSRSLLRAIHDLVGRDTSR